MKKTLIIVLLSLFLGIGLKVQAADNGTAYKTWTVNSSNQLVSTQDAYLAQTNITTVNVTNSDIQGFKTPEDIYLNDANNYFYLADTGNHRILKIDHGFKTAVAYGENHLVKPEGVYVSPQGLIYAADYELQKVVVFNDNGDIVNEFGKPSHPLYGSQPAFRPSKIIVDKVGTMFIVDAGNANGLVQMTADGDFLGYFGANYITPSFSYIIRFMFSTKVQKEKLYRQPIAPTNMAFDQDGLINTVTQGLSGTALKKLDIAGSNKFNNTMYDSSNFNDVAVGPIGNIYTVSKEGFIFEYDREGHLLFWFGGKDTTGKYLGLFSNPRAIEVDNDFKLYVIEQLNDKSSIQVFEETEFAGYVHESIKYFQDGLYEQSREPWEKVLQLNNMFDLAHEGLGKAYLQELRYREAMDQFRLAGDVSGYSEAFWEVRNEWIMQYTGLIVVSLFVLGVAYFVLNRLHVLDGIKNALKKGQAKMLKIRLVREVSFITTFIKHPIDGFYEIKKHRAVSILAACILYFIFFIEVVASNVFTGFIFNPVDVETISVGQIFFTSVAPVLLAVICNYLISSITEGNGRLRDTFSATICAFAPVILFTPFVILISNALTLNEVFIYQAANFILWGWSFVLLYFMVKETQDLSFGENNKNIFITIITMILFVAFGFLLYVLGSQVYNFIKDIVVEVLSNG